MTICEADFTDIVDAIILREFYDTRNVYSSAQLQNVVLLTSVEIKLATLAMCCWCRRYSADRPATRYSEYLGLTVRRSSSTSRAEAPAVRARSVAVRRTRRRRYSPTPIHSRRAPTTPRRSHDERPTRCVAVLPRTPRDTPSTSRSLFRSTRTTTPRHCRPSTVPAVVQAPPSCRRAVLLHRRQYSLPASGHLRHLSATSRPPSSPQRRPLTRNRRCFPSPSHPVP